MDYAKEYDRMVEQSNRQQEQLEQLRLLVANLQTAHDVAVRRITALKAGHARKKPFVVPPYARQDKDAYHRASFYALNKALEIVNEAYSSEGPATLGQP